MPIELTDDGTLDTVLRCSKCGEELRYNFAASSEFAEDDQSNETAYGEFVTWAIDDAGNEHECVKPSPRKLTRYERLQGLADTGIDSYCE